jgi:hypothetical protein
MSEVSEKSTFPSIRRFTANQKLELANENSRAADLFTVNIWHSVLVLTSPGPPHPVSSSPVETNDSTVEQEALTKGEPDVNDRPCADLRDGSPGILSSSTHQAEIADASSDAVPGGTMHIHRPKPLHGLREVLVEIGVIVIGVMIALAAEQLVEWAHWQERVRTGRREIHAEVAADAAFYGFRTTTEPCVVRRLNQLAEITEARAAGTRVTPVHFAGIHLGFLVSDNNWQAERAEQTLTHLPRAELEDLSQFYAQAGVMKMWVEKEEDAWATLRILEGDPNRLGQGDVAMLRNALQQARNFSFLIALNSKEQLDLAHKLGVKVPEPDATYVKRTCAPLDRSINPNAMGAP